ncbi:MAG: FAD-binding protein [Candidatus Sericytochromatia bacterium]|nr:FAD-binding protein [Candidatus Tanganyikabacteria bacterium]
MNLEAVHTLAPSGAEELSFVLHEAMRGGQGVLAVGGGTEAHIGNPPRRCDLVVETSRMAGPVGDYSPADLVLTVGAGTELAAIQEFLAGFGQRLPLEAPPGATAGGVVAAATAGKRRSTCGTPRDWLVGFQAVAGTAKVLRAGGKVVKNVTGYDLCKLFCGSRGSLGVLTEVSFKVAPLPEEIAVARMPRTNLSEVEEVRQAALAAGAAWCDLHGAGDLVVEVGCEGYREDVASQIARFAGERESHPGTEWQAEPPAPAFAEPLVVRIGALPDRLVSLLGTLPFERVHAHLGAGIARVVPLAGEGGPDASIAAWRAAVSAVGGWLVVERGPAGEDVFGPPRPEWELARRMKGVFDPDGILAPGRGPGRI